MRRIFLDLCICAPIPQLVFIVCRGELLGYKNILYSESQYINILNSEYHLSSNICFVKPITKHR